MLGREHVVRAPRRRRQRNVDTNAKLQVVECPEHPILVGYGNGRVTAHRDQRSNLPFSRRQDFIRHVHERMLHVFQGLTVINAGTIYRGNTQTFAVVDFEAMRVELYSAAPEDSGRSIEEVEFPAPGPAA